MTESINLPNISCFNHSTNNEMAIGIELPNRMGNSIKKSEMKLNQNSSPTTKKQKDFRQTTKNYIFHAPPPSAKKTGGPAIHSKGRHSSIFQKGPAFCEKHFPQHHCQEETILVAETVSIYPLHPTPSVWGPASSIFPLLDRKEGRGCKITQKTRGWRPFLMGTTTPSIRRFGEKNLRLFFSLYTTGHWGEGLNFFKGYFVKAKDSCPPRNGFELIIHASVMLVTHCSTIEVLVFRFFFFFFW